MQPTWALYRDLLSVQTITTINAALCEHHLHNCPPSEELLTECDKVGGVCRVAGSQLRVPLVPQQQCRLSNLPRDGCLSLASSRHSQSPVEHSPLNPSPLPN